MNTPAHLIFGAAAFGRANDSRATAAALAGGFAPDLSLYVMSAVSIWALGVSPHTVFREYYYSDAWQTVFAVDNSVLLWALLLAVALLRQWQLAVAFAGAGLLHLAFDLPLHSHDARRHFWPLSDWVFVSPVSYWDDAYHAGIVGPIEVGATMVLAVFCLWRFRQTWVRGTVLVLAAAEASASGVWRLVF